MRILYIDIDSQRPDHLGCYGYHRRTSPAIDQIAAEGVVFEKVYAPDAPCVPSRTAFYSGRFGIHTGVVSHGGTAVQPKIQGPGRDFQDTFYQQGLARQLQSLGYHTAVISTFGQRHCAWHFYAGFNEIHNTGHNGMESAEVVQTVVDKWLGGHAGEDHWYLHVNYWDPHTPYRTPPEMENPFVHEPLPEWLTAEGLIARHNRMAGPHTSLDLSMYDDREDPKFPRQPGKITDLASLRMVIDGYDMGVRHADDQIARIVATLKAAGVYDDTAIVISADHGENLGELGLYGEHATADDATCRVPLIIKFPGGARGARNTRLHYNLDLAPTLMDLLGGGKPDLWDGVSYASAVQTGADVGREELVISQCAHVCQRSVLWDQWLYVRTYHDGFHLFPEEMLYDLAADPHEENDLAARLPELCREGQWRLSRWHTAQMEKMVRTAEDAVDPLWTVMREGGPFHARLHRGDWPGQPDGGIAGFEKYLARLEATGRQAGADSLRTKYARQLRELRSPAEPGA